MEKKIENIEQLIEWFEDFPECGVYDIEDDSFSLQAPNDATWQIQFNINDDIETIIEKAIDQLRDFDAEERFNVCWCKEFREQNPFRPRQFLDMLEADEEFFNTLAANLEYQIKPTIFGIPVDNPHP